MVHWKPKHQFTKSLRDIVHRVAGLAAGSGNSASPPPPVPLVIRLGAAGSLHLGHDSEHLPVAINAILVALRTYADESANSRFHQKIFSHRQAPPPPQLRLFSQLAGGFDQMAASAALSIGYKLHVVLPGSRDAFRCDLQRNLDEETSAAINVGEAGQVRHPLRRSGMILPEKSVDPKRKGSEVLAALSRFEQLIETADRVLELDRDDESGDQCQFKLTDYAQAGSVILDHSDVVLVAVYEDQEPPFALGGTRWIEERAEGRDLTVIRVPVERPFDALLIWTVKGRRECRRLFEGDSRQADPLLFAAALDDQLLGPEFDLPKTQLGWLERRIIAQLDPEHNAKAWDRRWTLPSSDSLARHDLGQSPEQIDSDLKPAKVWADHRASAMAELVRGSFIICALLGVVAVAGALMRVLVPPLGETAAIGGEMVEVLCLALILWLVWRSRRYDWRSHWLSLRQLERFIEQAAWLLLVGRGRIYATPAHLAQFQTEDVAKWTNVYFRAVIRNSSFPTARLAADYLKTVHELGLQNLIVDQVAYFQGDEGEVRFQQKSDEFLERWTYIFVFTALIATVAYLFLTLSAWLLPRMAHLFPALASLLPAARSGAQHLVEALAMERTVPVLAALSTSAAAALSAIRYHGEYAQIAARYEGACEELEAIGSHLAVRLPDRRPDFAPRPLRSAYLASVIESATEVLIQEVQGWHAILQKKEIEPT